MVSVRYCCAGPDGARRLTVSLPAGCLSQPGSAARAAAGRLLGLPPDHVELVYRGRPLSDDRTLASYEVTSASVIHAFPRPATAPAAELPAPSQWEQTHLTQALTAATLSPGYRAVLERLGRPAVLDRLMAASPRLADDPAAVALLGEPAILLQLTDPAAVNRLMTQHPALAAAASELAAILTEESAVVGRAHAAAGPSRAVSAPAASAAAQAADAMDDDDDDVEPQLPQQQQQQQPITRELLASALAAAAAAPAAATPAAAAPAADTSAAAAPAAAAGPSQTSEVISSEMVSAALRDAMSTLPPPASQPGAQQQQPPPEPEVSDAAVRQLLELGITTDEALVRRALRAAGGDVDQAAELIYGSM